MITDAGIGQRLRQAREWAGFSQQQVSDVTGVPREVLSYWENERRTPSLAHLQRLAVAYGIDVDYLLGKQAAPRAADTHALIYRGLDVNAPRTRAEVRRWLAFLDAWADLLEESGEELPGRGQPPVRDWAGPRPITDSRRAPQLAREVREHYRLGLDAIPDLVTFLDQHGVLVYQVPLDRVDVPGSVSGIFYNHPRLGYCILVNTATTPGRQAFTLAHEFAHALFHYQETGLVSRAGDSARTERFADAFAAHFLVPAETLRGLVRQQFQGCIDSPYDVAQLQRYFRVSYAMLLNRLLDEGLMTFERYEEYRGYSPAALSARLGFETRQPEGTPASSLGRFPPSVLERVRTLVEDDLLSPPAAASLLDVSQETILRHLLAPPPLATDAERREFQELPLPRTSTAAVRKAGDG